MKESFPNPSNEQYKEVADLPEEQREKYVDIKTEGSTEPGFVEKSAVENDKKATIAARFMRVPGEYILHNEAEKFDGERDKTLKELDKIIESPDFKSNDFKTYMEVTLDAENAVEFSPFKKELCDSEEVMRKYIKIKGGGTVMHKMSDRLKNDKSFIIELLNTDVRSGEVGAEIGWLPDNMRSDPDIIMAAMKTAPVEAFSCAPDAKRNDLDFISTTLDAIERVYKPDMRLAAMNSLLGMIDPALAKDILEKRDLAK